MITDGFVFASTSVCSAISIEVKDAMDCAALLGTDVASDTRSSAFQKEIP